MTYFFERHSNTSHETRSEQSEEDFVSPDIDDLSEEEQGMYYDALAQGLFTENQIAGLPLYLLVNAECFGALREGLFTLQDLRGLEEDTMGLLMNTGALNALRLGFISLTEMHQSNWSDALLDPACLELIADGYLTSDQLKIIDCGVALTLLQFPAFASLLRDGTITGEDLSGLSDHHAHYLTQQESLSALQALREGFFTMHDIKQVPENNIREFLYPESIQALRDGLYTMDDLNVVNDRHEDGLDYFLRNCNFAALRENLYTINDIKEIDAEKIPFFLNQATLAALQKKHVMVDQLKAMLVEDMIDGVENGFDQGATSHSLR